MKAFTVLTSTVLPLSIDNIDTDQIIPARFLKAVDRKGFGEKLFYFWRYDEKGNPIISSPFNNPRYQKAKILLAGENFGVGSSREHAVWALLDFGFRVVIAASFGDIFYNNALKNGLLTVCLRKGEVDKLHQVVKNKPQAKVTIDLPNQHVSIAGGMSFSFKIDQFRKNLLVKGLDEFGYLLGLEKKITEFERNHKLWLNN